MFKSLLILLLILIATPALAVTPRVTNAGLHPYRHRPLEFNTVDTPSDEECFTYEASTTQGEWQSCGTGDSVTVNSTAVDTTANFLDGDIDFTLVDGGAGGPDDITATVGCTNCVTLTTETTGNYADGDAEAGAALTGDSATSFWSAGICEVARGCSGASTLTDGGCYCPT